MEIGLKDEQFIRGDVPMTKEEVRILSVVKMQLEQDSVVFDVGAGTGSVSVELARQCPKGNVYAVEKGIEGQRLIQENISQFHLKNVVVVKGEAPEVLDFLPSPTHAFIGGSNGKLIEIIETIRRKNPKVRFVVNAICLETLQALCEIGERFPEYKDMELVQVSISKNRKLGSRHLLQAENPVYIASFGGGRTPEMSG